MSGARIAFGQMRYAFKSTLRNPPAVFFGLALPVIFLLVFATIFGNETIESRGGITQATYYVPGLIALGIVSTTFVNLSLTLVFQREQRALKRLRGTPLPTWALLAGRIATAAALGAALTVLLLLIGLVAYGVDVPGSTLPGLIVAVIVGSAAFCALAVAFSSLIPNEDAAPAVVNAMVLPLYFISGLFFPTDEAPSWLNDVASVFPIEHLSEALLATFEPGTSAPGIEWGHLAVVAAWGVAGALIGSRTFRWTPKGE